MPFSISIERSRSPSAVGVPGIRLSHWTSRDAWPALSVRTGWRIDNADEVTAVDHFEVTVADHPTQIQTRFLTATA